jgi:hypothetical protein
MMPFRNAAVRMRMLLISPDQEWRAIAADPVSARAALATHLIPLCALLAAAWTTGAALFPLQPWPAPAALPMFVLTFVFCLVAIGLQGAAMGILLPMYGRHRQWRRSITVSAYGATPVLLTGMLLIYPLLVIVSVLVLPAMLYQQYLGAQHVLGVARGDAAEFVAGSALLSLGASIAAGAVLAALDLL